MGDYNRPARRANIPGPEEVPEERFPQPNRRRTRGQQQRANYNFNRTGEQHNDLGVRTVTFESDNPVFLTDVAGVEVINDAVRRVLADNQFRQEALRHPDGRIAILLTLDGHHYNLNTREDVNQGRVNIPAVDVARTDIGYNTRRNNITPLNYNVVSREVEASLNSRANTPGALASNTAFGITILSVTYTFYQEGGGCQTKKHIQNISHGLLYESARSQKHNCFFSAFRGCLKDTVVKELMDMYKYDTIRKKIGVTLDCFITLQDVQKFMDWLNNCVRNRFFNVTIYTPNGDSHEIAYRYVNADFEERNDEVKVELFLYNGHYYTVQKVNAAFIKCESCGETYSNTKEHHCYKTCEVCNTKYKLKHNNCAARVEHRNLFFTKRDSMKINSYERKEYSSSGCLFFDFETWHNKNETLMKTYVISYCVDENEPKVFKGKDCMKLFIQDIFFSCLYEDMILVGYNNSRFDNQILIQALIDYEYVDRDNPLEEVLYSNGRLLSFKFKGVKTFDLCLFTLGSLRDSCKAFSVEHEKTFFPHFFVNNEEKAYNTDAVYDKPGIEYYPLKDRNEILESEWIEKQPDDFHLVDVCSTYCANDVVATRELFTVFSKRIHDLLGVNLKEYLTLPQLSMDVWKDMIKQEYGNNKEFFLPCLNNDYFQNAIKQSYYGGRVFKKVEYFNSNCNPHEEGELKMTDFASMYPAEMLKNLFPFGNPEVEKYNKNMTTELPIGFFRISYKPLKRTIYPLLPRRVDNNVIWDLMDSEGWYTSVDINEAWLRGYKIFIYEGFYWKNTIDIFSKYVNKFYTLRSQPEYKDIAKLFLNSLYGKFFEKTFYTEVMICSTEKDIDIFLNKYDWEFFLIAKKTVIMGGTPKNSANIRQKKANYISPLVTAFARKSGTRVIEAADPNAFNPNCLLDERFRNPVYYSDTDSFIVNKESFRLLTSKGLIPEKKTLGLLADELPKLCVRTAYFVAPKFYYLHKDVIGSKGVSNELIDEEHMKTILLEGFVTFKDTFLMRKAGPEAKFNMSAFGVEGVTVDKKTTIRSNDNSNDYFNNKYVVPKGYLLNDFEKIYFELTPEANYTEEDLRNCSHCPICTEHIL